MLELEKYNNNCQVRLNLARQGKYLEYFRNDFNPNIRAKTVQLGKNIEYLKDDEDIMVRREVAKYYSGLEKLDIILNHSNKEKENMETVYTVIFTIKGEIERIELFNSKKDAEQLKLTLIKEYINKEQFKKFKNDIIKDSSEDINNYTELELFDEYFFRNVDDIYVYLINNIINPSLEGYE